MKFRPFLKWEIPRLFLKKKKHAKPQKIDKILK